MHIIKLLAVALIVALTAGFSSLSAEGAGGKGHSAPATHHDTIAAIDTATNKVTVKPGAGGANVTYIVDAQTKITIDSKNATIADLKVGDSLTDANNGTAWTKLAVTRAAAGKSGKGGKGGGKGGGG
jgi:hypothetical protein